VIYIVLFMSENYKGLHSI